MITVSETQCSSNIRGARDHTKVISPEELRMIKPGSLKDDWAYPQRKEN